MHVVRDFFAFIGRLGIGIILIAHGWQKLVDYGIGAVAGGFAEMNIPLPQLAAWFTALVELVGGAFFILGLLLPLVGILIAVVMAGAVFFVHLPHGLFSPEGFELPLAIGVAALALGFNGGRWSIDHGMFGRRRAPAENAAGEA
ncbi:putative oxidoreductase [Saccharopolyspora kobensis]|uniref:Oxidoreductase n=1 Tax=Saccharopolyspora kobensis TaxID=146035 RepID=A0A1H5WXB3_9PSEU|nr:DoxX family protein [Saccharopolyspora kobensis]SEG03637.1 putative oxidoreductase [Saccharopolyspora kobensis]SFD80274.1 putative oxidoreductase [Saccharopolyspora kobensis]